MSSSGETSSIEAELLRYISGKIPINPAMPIPQLNPSLSKPSPQAVLLFLKHAALDPEWGTKEIRKTLGVDSSAAKEVASELQLMGYSEPVPGKSRAWRNTESRSEES